MRALLLLALLAWSALAEAGLWDKADWRNLWQTPDQRGEQLMKQGNPAGAVAVFKDPRRKAYAELRAGDYQHAAHDFAAFGDSDSQYNRGNALARAGDLKEALKAYDAALARDPDNRDARHNRDLVAEALKHPPPPKQPSASGSGTQGAPQQNGGRQSQSGGNGSEQQAHGGQSGQTGNRNKTGQNGKPDGSGDKGQNRSGPSKAAQDQAPSGSGRNPSGSGQGRPNPEPAAQNGPATTGQAPQPTQAAQPGQASPMGQAGQQSGATPPGQDTAADALADAQAALHGQPGATDTVETPLSERQLAQQDWLRRIPDDPGGLLRRKFLIEHMLRQQGGQP